MASTALIWALPGQLIFVEMHALSASVIATVIAVMLSSARFLPMTLMLVPEMRDPAHRPWKYYLVAQLLSLSGWTMAVMRFPEMPREQRLPCMLFMPTGELAEIALWERAIGSAAALVAYFWMTKRNLFVGTVAGALALWLVRLVR